MMAGKILKIGLEYVKRGVICNDTSFSVELMSKIRSSSKFFMGLSRHLWGAGGLSDLKSLFGTVAVRFFAIPIFMHNQQCIKCVIC